MLYDVHAHLDDNAFSNDLDHVIENAIKVGISFIINNGTNKETNRKTIELSNRFKIIKPALGIYPDDAIDMEEEEIEKEIEFIKENGPVAIGEIGLDYYRTTEKDKIKKQKRVFESMISLAEQLKIPAIVHSRRAEEDVIDILESSRLKKIVLHCFQGDLRLMKRAEDRGFFFSVPPMIVYSKQQQLIVEKCSINQILTESDSPYLGIKRGERNQPSNIIRTIEMISEITKRSKTDIEEKIENNVLRLFRK